MARNSFLIISFVLSLLAVTKSWKWQRTAARACVNVICAASVLSPSASFSLLQPQSAWAAGDLKLAEFIVKLEKNEIKTVVFNGVNPRSATLFYSDGSTGLLTEMPIEDPKSASGSAQLIAKCQHTPGVVCRQDVSDVLKLAKTRKTYIGKALNDQLSHNSYPTEFSYDAEKGKPTAAATMAKEYL